MQTARITLANGLRVNLIHDPDASRTAALIQLAAGSHDGPPEWPGLAHLLEHLLFAGSAGYQDQQRLMAWGPANGARLNATTRACHTAWFFDIAPEKAAQGLCRLTDMLAFPLLTRASVSQEVAVIEAEFQLLSRHTETLREAALSQAFATPHPLHAFHVGNSAVFGTDHAALQQALKTYHQRFFRAENLELWLQGPQSVEELAGLAEAGTVFRALPAVHDVKAPSLKLNPHRHYGLHLASAERLQLSAVLPVMPEMFALLRELLMDSAAGSLLATLRERGIADNVALAEPWRTREQSVVSVEFALSHAACPANATVAGRQPASDNSERSISTDAPLPPAASGQGQAPCAPPEAVFAPAAVEALFSHWLQQLATLDEAVLCHYAALARRRFAQLTVVDRLRARAFGFVPPAQNVPLKARWQALLAGLQPGKLTALWTSSQVVASPTQLQGLALHSGVISWPPSPLCRVPDMAFYRPGQTDQLPALPVQKAPLITFSASCLPVLLLTPVPPFARESAALVEAALQPVIGQCLHQGGELSFVQQQGLWLLQLSAAPDLLLSVLATVIAALENISPAVISQGRRRYHQAMQPADIAIHRLLSALPEQIGATQKTTHAGAWQATLYGGEPTLQEATARLLSRWPGKQILLSSALHSQWQQPAPAPVTRAGKASACVPVYDGNSPTQPPAHREAAVLLFCPLVEQTAACLAAWQLLATLYEPAFFQQLRVEQNIGYVVSCRFHQIAGQAGLLFALQSPTLHGDRLKGHISHFISTMTEVVAAVTREVLQRKAADLSAALPGLRIGTPAQCLAHWQQQQLNLPTLSPACFAAFTPEALHDYAQRLCKEDRGWIWAAEETQR